VGGRAVGLDNLAHSIIVPLLGHRDVVSMKARRRARGETSTGRASRGRAARAAMSVTPMTPTATTVAPSHCGHRFPHHCGHSCRQRGDAHEYRTARASWSSRSYRDEKVALRFLRELQADVICAERFAESPLIEAAT
jgi:hypothetical protein